MSEAIHVQHYVQICTVFILQRKTKVVSCLKLFVYITHRPQELPRACLVFDQSHWRALPLTVTLD
jgi:hypothetical protein